MTVKPETALGPPLLGALLRVPLDAVRARMLVGLHEGGFTDLVAAHLAVLRYPGPQGQRPSELAAQMGMTKQAMNYLLTQLEQLGYLTRADHEADQRSKQIELTERGYAAAKNIRRTVRQIEREVERELGEAKFGRLRNLLVELNETTFVQGR